MDIEELGMKYEKGVLEIRAMSLEVDKGSIYIADEKCGTPIKIVPTTDKAKKAIQRLLKAYDLKDDGLIVKDSDGTLMIVNYIMTE
jgi:hypothetical protein